jgi:hypothetical protein
MPGGNGDYHFGVFKVGYRDDVRPDLTDVLCHRVHVHMIVLPLVDPLEPPSETSDVVRCRPLWDPGG